MKILITGASGFVGKNVKEFLLSKGYDIVFPNSKELDCLDEKSVREHLEVNHYDIVLHFAVYGDGIDKTKDGTKVLDYNLRMFWNFANYSYLYGKMIYTGSGAEYDKRYPIKYVTEEDLKDHSLPIDNYGLMKYTVNSIIENSTNIYNLRLFGIFGKYEFWKTKYISNLCCKSIKNLPLTMRKNCYFDYLWIDDFCVMLEKFMLLDKPNHKTYNAVSGRRIDLYTIAEIVKKVSGKENEIIVCQQGYANEYTASNQRILEEIPDMVFTDIEEAIKKLYKWYEDNQEKIDIYSLIYG